MSKDSKQAALNDLNGQPDEKFKKIFNLLYSQNLRVNLFKEFDVNEVFEVTILSVNPKFRGQGIAKQLLIQSEQIARDNGFRVRFLLYFHINHSVDYLFIIRMMLCIRIHSTGDKIRCNGSILSEGSGIAGFQTMFAASLR